MAIVATIFGLLGRFVGKLLTAALGWASSLLFGRVPQDRQILLVLMTFGSVVWVVLVVGVIVPEVGTMLLAFVPIPDVIDETWVRIGMLIGAILVPLGIGVAALLIQESDDRASGGAAIATILRGYPLAFVLAVVLVFLGVVAIVRKGRALLKRWKDAHVPVVVRPGGYHRTVDDLERALDEAGLEVRRGSAPAVLAMPPRLLATVAGSGVRALVPDRLVQLTGKDLEVQLYPSDVALAGREVKVNRARAALASRLTAAPAFLTTSAEAQAIEERLEALAKRRRYDSDALQELRALDDRLAHLELDYEEWEVLYRMRLQVERDLLTGRQPGAVPGEPAGQVRGAASGRSGTPIEYATAAGLVALLVADIALALRDRVGR